MYAGIIWITKRQSIVRRDKCPSENEVLSTAHQLHSSSKTFNTKTLLIDRINFIKTLFNLNSIFLHFNGKSSLFIRAKEFSHSFFFGIFQWPTKWNVIKSSNLWMNSNKIITNIKLFLKPNYLNTPRTGKVFFHTKWWATRRHLQRLGLTVSNCSSI